MNHALIWIEALASTLLLLATIAALVARWRKRWARMLVLVLAILPLLALAGSAWFLTLRFKYGDQIENAWFYYTSSWLVLFLIGVVVLFSCVRGRRGAVLPPRAYAWPRGQLALGFIAATVLLYMTVCNLDLAVRMQQASLRAEAGAMTLALMPPRIPDADNAALVYKEAIEAMTEPQGHAHVVRTKIFTKPFDDKSKELAKDPQFLAYLAAQERPLTLLRKAAAMPNCLFDSDVRYPIHSESELFHLELQLNLKVLIAAKLLLLDALVRSNNLDAPGVAADLVALLNFARHVRHTNVPTLMSVLIAMAIERVATDTLEVVLSRVELSPDELERLPLSNTKPYRQDMARSIRMEEAGDLALFALLCNESPPLPELVQIKRQESEEVLEFLRPLAVLWRVYYMRAEVAAFGPYINKVRHLIERPYCDAEADWQALVQNYRPAGPIAERLIINPSIYKAYAIAAEETDALPRLSRLAVAMTLFKRQHGMYPKRQEELIPAFLPQPLLNPFDGQPLRMRPNGDGLMLYSAGPDGREIRFRLK